MTVGCWLRCCFRCFAVLRFSICRGWSTLNNPNVFPGECPRRFVSADRVFFFVFARLLCALAKTSLSLLLSFSLIFRQLRLFGKGGPP